MASKTVALKLDDSNEGGVSAVFSTLNVVDKDTDVTLPGAFATGAPVRIASYGHKLSELPVGRGVITSDDKSATMTGRFFTETTAGKDTYLTVKEMGDLQEWSYEYDVLDHEMGTFKGQKVRFLKSLKVHGVTPVYIGAGEGTRTLDIKEFSSHGEEVLSVLSDYYQRVKERADFRAKEGRTLSSSNRNRLSALLESMGSLRGELEKLLEETDPEKSSRELAQLRAMFLREEARRNGVLV